MLHLAVRGSGDGGIHTTVGDVHTFWAALFAGRIVPPDRVAEMVRPRSDVPAESKRYGLGFWLDPSDDKVILEGYDAGVSFHTVHDPTSGDTWTVISNSSDGAWPIARLLPRRLSGRTTHPSPRADHPRRASTCTTQRISHPRTPYLPVICSPRGHESEIEHGPTATVIRSGRVEAEQRSERADEGIDPAGAFGPRSRIAIGAVRDRLDDLDVDLQLGLGAARAHADPRAVDQLDDDRVGRRIATGLDRQVGDPDDGRRPDLRAAGRPAAGPCADAIRARPSTPSARTDHVRVAWWPKRRASRSSRSQIDSPSASATAATSAKRSAALMPSLSRTTSSTEKPSASSKPNTKRTVGSVSPGRTTHLKPVGTSA